MKAILEFDLPEDYYKFRKAINGVKWSTAMWNTDSQLRTIIKHSDDWTDDQKLAFEEARAILRESMEINNLSFDE